MLWAERLHMSKQSGKLARPFESEAVAETFNAYPPRIRKRLMALRFLIFETADKTEGVGALEETLNQIRHFFSSIPRTTFGHNS